MFCFSSSSSQSSTNIPQQPDIKQSTNTTTPTPTKKPAAEVAAVALRLYKQWEASQKHARTHEPNQAELPAHVLLEAKEDVYGYEGCGGEEETRRRAADAVHEWFREEKHRRQELVQLVVRVQLRRTTRMVMLKEGGLLGSS
ncbi:hypothetical protein GTA08_BOTSDO04246 [Botryosphaeria dothidea]|uniref:Uncharacterized protein n=1 Tax=Botryosphaeria dothidea TaxID=55169 RepID=A0A8H4IWI1_9PEZI|nr:hypothetical protein GTA08_BOTSDO04246 [Botryosphaeria dothidea]